MITIALVNQKGGVGKSTTAVNLSAGLARLGKRVLVVDLDPQAHSTVALGLDPRRLDKTVYTLLSGAAQPADVIRPVSERLSIMPANIHLAGGEAELASIPHAHSVLRRAMQNLDASAYDVVIVDSPPQLGFLNVNSLAWVQEVYIPVTCEFYALHGLSLLMDTIDRVKTNLNPALKVAGVITCMVHPRRAVTREVLADLERHFPGRVLKTRIRVNVRLVEAPSRGKTIFDHAPESNGAADYLSLAQEVFERLPASVPVAPPMLDALADLFPAPGEGVVEEPSCIVEAIPTAEIQAPAAPEPAAEAPTAESLAPDTVVLSPEPVVEAAPAPEPEPAPVIEAPAPVVESPYVALPEGAPETTPVAEPAPSQAALKTNSAYVALPAGVPPTTPAVAPLGQTRFAEKFGMAGLKPIVTSKPSLVAIQGPAKKESFTGRLFGKLIGRKS